jgi:uncharacterized membrane protein
VKEVEPKGMPKILMPSWGQQNLTGGMNPKGKVAQGEHFARLNRQPHKTNWETK